MRRRVNTVLKAKGGPTHYLPTDYSKMATQCITRLC